ncbi:uncharacterized protein LOC130429723 [Triplophysa dalaica]|uniref:uncharacterized protein LOC130429723 n=1 Tax=Triplophysa dalaica TaxID=1582913 RepID=UPI0024DF9CCF|nr:uncharacterized protein LOC130429723 [Triplophysa dalaica]
MRVSPGTKERVYCPAPVCLISTSDSLYLSMWNISDTNTYSCVVSNPVSNQTQHLNITHVCGLIPPAHGLQPLHIALIVVFAVIFTVALFVGICYKKFRKPKNKAQPTEEELHVLNGSSPADQRNVGLSDGDQVDQPNDARVETSNLEADSHNLLNDEGEVEQPNDGLNTTEYDDEIKEIKDEFKTLYVQEGECVTLRVNELIEEDDVIQWSFAESRLNTIKTEVIAERTNANDGKILCSDKTLQLDNQTGFLTITNITPNDTGHYKLWIPKKRISKTFNITVNKRVKGDIPTDNRRGANSEPRKNTTNDETATSS